MLVGCFAFAYQSSILLLKVKILNFYLELILVNGKRKRIEG